LEQTPGALDLSSFFLEPTRAALAVTLGRVARRVLVFLGLFELIPLGGAGFQPVLFLGAKAAGFDDQHTLGSDAVSANFTSRSFTSAGREGEFFTSQRSWAEVATLFTFCPPGPRRARNRTGVRIRRPAAGIFFNIMKQVKQAIVVNVHK